MKAIVTVIGRDTVGIIAAVSTYLAESGVNILDISQTIMGGMFTMIMMVDTATSDKPFEVLSHELESVGTRLGVAVTLQNEKIFDSMHRL